jgi:hypothetical protein
MNSNQTLVKPLSQGNHLLGYPTRPWFVKCEECNGRGYKVTLPEGPGQHGQGAGAIMPTVLIQNKCLECLGGGTEVCPLSEFYGG